MTSPVQATIRNHLLKRLTPDEFALIADGLEPLDMTKRMEFAMPGECITHAHFPDCGLGSVVAISPEGHKSEIGLFGVDGMSGTTLLLDTSSDATR